MPLFSFTKDPANLAMTVVAEFGATVERVWDAYGDSRQLEKFRVRSSGQPLLPGTTLPSGAAPTTI